jgi:hypothetical protein
MPLDDTNMNRGGGGGGPGPSDFERAMAIILATAMPARPTFEPTEDFSTERIQFELVMRVTPDGKQFSPFGLMVLEWCKIEFEDPADDPAEIMDRIARANETES